MPRTVPQSLQTPGAVDRDRKEIGKVSFMAFMACFLLGFQYRMGTISDTGSTRRVSISQVLLVLGE